MTDRAAIAGMLVDAKNIASHKTFRLSIEIPAEEAMKAIEAFGWPTQVNPVPVAVARMNLKPEKEVVPDTAERTAQHGSDDKYRAGGKRAWSELPPAQQAGIRCNEEAFQRFIAEDCLYDINSAIAADDAADAVRDICGVASRSELNTNKKAAQRWRDLEARYQAWLTVPA